MPTEPKLNTAKLPPELCEVETLLKQFSPSASAMNRDTLMYQAGYAAAEAMAPRKTPWLWPATTAALAASLLFLLARPPASPLQRAGTPPENPVQAEVAHSEPVPEPVFVRAAPLPLKRYSPSAPMLVMRERALRGEFGDSHSQTDLEPWTQPSSFTNRQLLHEFLPSLPEPSLGGNS